MGSHVSCTVRCISTTSSSATSTSSHTTTRHSHASSVVSTPPTSATPSCVSTSLDSNTFSQEEQEALAPLRLHTQIILTADRRYDAFEGISNVDDIPHNAQNPLVTEARNERTRQPLEFSGSNHHLQRKCALLSGGMALSNAEVSTQPSMLTFEPILCDSESQKLQPTREARRPSTTNSTSSSRVSTSPSDILEGEPPTVFPHCDECTEPNQLDEIGHESVQNLAPVTVTQKLKKRKVKASRRRRRYVRESMALGRSVSFSNSQRSQSSAVTESSEECVNVPPSSPLTVRRVGGGSVTFDIPHATGRSSMIAE